MYVQPTTSCIVLGTAAIMIRMMQCFFFFTEEEKVYVQKYNSKILRSSCQRPGLPMVNSLADGEIYDDERGDLYLEMRNEAMNERHVMWSSLCLKKLVVFNNNNNK
jgi:hypothetical protein